MLQVNRESFIRCHDEELTEEISPSGRSKAKLKLVMPHLPHVLGKRGDHHPAFPQLLKRSVASFWTSDAPTGRRGSQSLLDEMHGNKENDWVVPDELVLILVD